MSMDPWCMMCMIICLKPTAKKLPSDGGQQSAGRLQRAEGTGAQRATAERPSMRPECGEAAWAPRRAPKLAVERLEDD